MNWKWQMTSQSKRVIQTLCGKIELNDVYLGAKKFLIITFQKPSICKDLKIFPYPNLPIYICMKFRSTWVNSITKKIIIK